MGWQAIETAPKNGEAIRVKRVVDGRDMFERVAVWRSITLPETFIDGMTVPEEAVTCWAYPDIDKRVPEPTHWWKDL